MAEYYLAETSLLRHGVRKYAGTQEQLQSLRRKLAEDPVWANVFPDPEALNAVKVLAESTDTYPRIRLGYLDLNGDYYKIRADETMLHYLWIEHDHHWYRMVRPELKLPLWDREDSPHGWRTLPRCFLGVPELMSWDGVTLSARCYMQDDYFISLRETMADIATPPPAINLQSTFDEIFSPA